MGGVKIEISFNFELSMNLLWIGASEIQAIIFRLRSEPAQKLFIYHCVTSDVSLRQRPLNCFEPLDWSRVSSLLFRIMRQTPDLGPSLPVSRFESEISRVIGEFFHFF